MNREVAVKTLIGKGRQYLVKEVNLQVNTKPSKALGCWIINHQYVPYNKDKELFIKGSYDIVDADRRFAWFYSRWNENHNIYSSYFKCNCHIPKPGKCRGLWTKTGISCDKKCSNHSHALFCIVFLRRACNQYIGRDSSFRLPV